MRSSRRGLDAAIRAVVDEQIQARVLALECVRAAQRIALYRAYDGETATDALRDAFDATGRAVTYAAATSGEPVRFVDVREWRHVGRGLPVPYGPEVRLESGDVVIVPVVAVCEAGYRIGMGGGCYDRGLVSCPAHAVGIGYEFQRIASFARDPWDRPLDSFVCEAAIHHYDPPTSIVEPERETPL